MVCRGERGGTARGAGRPPPLPTADVRRTMSGSSASPAEGTYLYCIIRSREPRSLGPMGIGGRGAEVHTTHYRDLAAGIFAPPPLVYDPTRDNAFAHYVRDP